LLEPIECGVDSACRYFAPKSMLYLSEDASPVRLLPKSGYGPHETQEHRLFERAEHVGHLPTL